tara:strand:+ start:10048 stop:10827 length:780 start_codon:yes stop_codon:yes gene_type:complete
MTTILSSEEETKLILVGATGKLGKSISQNNSITFGVCSKENPFLGKVIENIQEPLVSSLSEVSLGTKKKFLVIDASYPENFENVFEFCLKNKIPLVLASTGHSEEQLKKLEKLSMKVPVLKAPNLSTGISFFKAQLLKSIISDISSKAIGGRLNPTELNIRIIETHHKNKKDAPSGTALDLKEYINKNLKLDFEIEIESIRDESSVGKHEVIFKIKNEEFKVSHNALSRDIFGEGIIVALHILKKKPGIYSVSDLAAHF